MNTCGIRRQYGREVEGCMACGAAGEVEEDNKVIMGQLRIDMGLGEGVGGRGRLKRRRRDRGVGCNDLLQPLPWHASSLASNRDAKYAMCPSGERGGGCEG